MPTKGNLCIRMGHLTQGIEACEGALLWKMHIRNGGGEDVSNGATDPTNLPSQENHNHKQRCETCSSGRHPIASPVHSLCCWVIHDIRPAASDGKRPE